MINVGDNVKRRTLTRKPRRGGESPRVMGQKHNLRCEGQAWDLEEPRMVGVAGTECKFHMELEFEMLIDCNSWQTAGIRPWEPSMSSAPSCVLCLKVWL